MNGPVENNLNAPDWLPSWLENIWNLLSTFPILLALVIIGVGLCLAIVIRWFVLFWGLKLTSRTNADLVAKLLRLGAGLAAVVVGYISLVTALHTLPLSHFTITVTIRILLSILVLQLIRAALKASTIGLEMLGRIRNRFAIVEERTIPLFDLMLTVIIVAIGSYALLQVWNIDATAWLASAGVIGIAVGFAARDTLANLFAGFFIIADAPYKHGDYVVLDSGERGEITKVGIRSTRLLTRDDVEITIPNSVIANAKILNESGGRWVKYRIRIKVGVAYGSDLDQVIKVLQSVAEQQTKVCHNPPPRVRMRGFGDSSLDFELLCWIEHPVDRGVISHKLYMAIYKAFAEHEIEIPFPQRDLWIKKQPGSSPFKVLVKKPDHN